MAVLQILKAQEKLKIYRQAVLKKALKEANEGLRKKPTCQPQTNSGTNQRGASETTTQATARRLKKAVKDWEKNIEVGSKPSKPRRWKDLRALDKKVILFYI
jgi:hypothetical protein